MGRLVWNHSTHVEGLIAVLKKLVEHPDVSTVTPARLKPMKRANRSGKVRLRVTVKILGGWKLKAVRGRLAQEVFVVTVMDKDALQAVVDALI